MTHESYKEFSLYLSEPVNDTMVQILVHKEVQSPSTGKGSIFHYEGMDEMELGDLTPEVSTFFSASIGDNGGSITVEVTHKPFPYYTILEDVCLLQQLVAAPKGRGKLVVIIHEGIGFKGKSHTNTFASFFVTSSINGETVVICDTCNPMWEQPFYFDVEARELIGPLVLEVVSISRKGLTRFLKVDNELIGKVQIRISDIINKKRINKLYALNKRSGWVQVELQWISSD